MKQSEKLYLKYEYLAKKYANKIFSYEELSFEYEDLLQEFRIKIFTSLKSYGRRYAKFRRGEASKPVPLRFYLEAACSNKARDFIKYISTLTALPEASFKPSAAASGTAKTPPLSQFIL